MIINMRTTLIIDDQVFNQAKRRALETGMTFSDFTTLALREALNRSGQSAVRGGRFSMVTYGPPSTEVIRLESITTLRDEGR